VFDDPGVGAEAQDGWTPPPGYARRRFREHRSWTPSAARGQSSPGANVLANYVSLAPTETLRREWHVMSDDEQSQLPSMGSLRGPRKSNTKAIRANPVRRPALRQARSRSTGPEASHRAQRCAGGDPLHGPALDNAPRLAGEAPARLELGSQRCPGGPPCHHRRCLEAAGRPSHLPYVQRSSLTVAGLSMAQAMSIVELTPTTMLMFITDQTGLVQRVRRPRTNVS